MPKVKPNKTVDRAAELRKKYSPEELREVIQLTDAELRMLDRIASGQAPRNAIAILRAIDIKLNMAYSKPKQEVEHSGAVSVSIEINRTVSGGKKDD